MANNNEEERRKQERKELEALRRKLGANRNTKHSKPRGWNKKHPRPKDD
jgi:hypothetical protein